MAGANGSRHNGGRPAWQRLTKAQREAFLELVRDGATRPKAALAVKATARAFRALCRYDSGFDGAYEEARQHGRKAIIDDLDDEWAARAKVNDRLFWYRLVSYHPAAAWARTNRVSLEDAEGKALEIRLAFDPSADAS